MTPKKVFKVSEAKIPTVHGDFRAVVFESIESGEQHVAFVKGVVANQEDTLVRVHSECLTGDIFGSLRCDCGPQLHAAMDRINAEGTGVVVYLQGQEGRGIGLGEKISAYSLQDKGFDTVDANTELGLPVDSREYSEAAQVLIALGIQSVRLLSNNPAKVEGLTESGIEVTEKITLYTTPNEHNLEYLKTKQQRMGHNFGNLFLS